MIFLTLTLLRLLQQTFGLLSKKFYITNLNTKEIAKKMNLVQHNYNSQISAVSTYARQCAEVVCRQLLGRESTNVLDENIKKLNSLNRFPPAFIYALNTVRKKANDNVHHNNNKDFTTKSQIADALLFIAVFIAIQTKSEKEILGDENDCKKKSLLHSWYTNYNQQHVRAPSCKFTYIYMYVYFYILSNYM